MLIGESLGGGLQQSLRPRAVPIGLDQAEVESGPLIVGSRAKTGLEPGRGFTPTLVLAGHDPIASVGLEIIRVLVHQPVAIRAGGRALSQEIDPCHRRRDRHEQEEKY